MFNLDDITNENSKEHSERWPIILNHPCRILIIGESGSGKTNALLNLISHQDDFDKIHLHAKDLSEPKYQFLIKKREDAGVKHSNYSNYSIGVQILWMTFTKILMIITQTEKEEYLHSFLIS